ncbi:MAG: 50S ribosome-binding GTPase [Phycisphaerae bacterium]|nr:50S ribosome-binding GTPase [Phycisphaerae bacterium]
MIDTAGTIVAVSSPSGPAVRGIVRLSGPDAVSIAAQLFRPQDGASLADLTGNRRISGTLRIDGAIIPGVAYVFRTPRSYTREDLVELHVLGSPGLLARIVELCRQNGARTAGHGEFTARAFLSGALDLSEAQGVAAMISASSDDEARAAQRLLDGELSRRAHAAREELADLLSLVESGLDFADEPIEFIAADELQRRLGAVRATLEQTLAAGAAVERFGRPPRVVLCGQPNAGKSSLLNRLAGFPRAVTSPRAGTTRDALSVVVPLTRTDVLLFDVAGEEAGDAPLNAPAQAAAGLAVRDADLVVRIMDGTAIADGQPSHATRQRADLVVLNKIDLLDPNEAARCADLLRTRMGVDVVMVSSQTGEGIDVLRRALDQRVSETGTTQVQELALTIEHREALQAAIEALRRSIALAADADAIQRDAELIALELHAAAESLGQLVGILVPDELLGRIFSRFCIGK